MMITMRSTAWRYAVLAALLLSLASTAITPSPTYAGSDSSDQDDERHTPLAVKVSMEKTPTVNETTEVTIVVSSTEPVTGVRVEVVTSEGMRIDDEREFVIDLKADQERKLKTRVTSVIAGNQTVAANVSYDLGGGNVWGDSDAVYFSNADGASSSGFAFAGDPMSGGASPGPGNDMEVTPETFPDRSMPAFAHDEETLLPVDTGEPGSELDAPEEDAAALAGNLTIRGNTGMFDRNGYWKNQMLLVELLGENGVTITWTYSNFDGNYAFSVPNPGKFRIRVWANYRHDSMQIGAIRVVGSGLQTPNRFSMAGWHYNIPTMGPFPNGEVNVGSWAPAYDWDGRRAWWIYQDLIDGFFSTWNQVPSGVPAGSRQPDGVTVEWQPGSTDGTFYRQNERRVHLEDVDANSDHTVLHEYGHAVMHNVYGSMPTSDCPKPHYVSRTSGTNCAWIEGWADFFSIYVKYDPVITWGCTLPCTPESINLEETHVNPIELWDDGDTVEGNVAASLWDFIDPYTDGLDKTNSAITPFWKIWDIVWNYNHDTFSQFWTSWYTNVNYTNSVATLYQNTIDYGWTHCQDYTFEPDDNHLEPRNIANPADPAYRRVLCTDNDVDYFRFDVVAGSTYTIETMDLGTAVDGSIGGTTLTLYSMGQFGGLTQLAYDDNGGSQYLTSRIVQTAATNGTYVVGVRHATGRGHFAYGYGIDFTAPISNAPPTVTAPVTSIMNNLALGNPSAGVIDVPLQDKWTRSDPDGIASQDLERCLNAGCVFTDVSPQPTATATSANYRLPVGTVSQSQLRVIDALGADSGYMTGPKVVVRGFQETDAAFTYSGSWANLSNTASFGGAVTTTTGAVGTKASFLFYGQSVALVATKRSDAGKADIYVDSVFKAAVDFYAGTQKNRQIVWVQNGLNPTKADGTAHVLEIRWRTDKNASSSGRRLFLDGVIVLTPAS